MPWERSGTCKGAVHEPSGVGHVRVQCMSHQEWDM